MTGRNSEIDKLKEQLAREAEARKAADERLRKLESDLSSVIDNIQDVFYRSDADGKLIMVSRSWLELAGYASLDECLGRDIAETFYYDPAKRDEFLELLKRNGSVSNYETVLKTKDGNPIVVETSSHIYYGRDGNYAGVEGILRDISERKKAENELRRSEEFLESIVNASPVPQFVIDREHIVTHWNHALEMYSGIKPDEIVGTKEHWRAFYHEQRPCLADLVLDGSMGTVPEWYRGKYSASKLVGDAFEAVDYFPDMKGGVWLYFTAAPIRDERGEIIGAVETLEDISERKRNEEALVDSRNQLRRHASFLEALLSAVPIPVFYKDADGRFLGCNDLYSEIMGVKRADFVGKTVFDIWPSEMAEMYHEKDLELLHNREIQVYEYIMKNRKGEDRNVIFRKSLFFNENGSIAGIVGAYFDITDQKAIQEALRMSEDKFRTIFNDSPVGIVQTTLDGHILSANRAFCDMMNYSAEEILKLTVADISFEGDFERERPAVRRLRGGGSNYYSFEKRYRTKDGATIWGHVSIAYIHDSEGNPLSAIGIVENITDRKRADEELKRMETQLLQSQKSEALGTLAGGIAHDFNNILSAIIGYTELARLYVDNKERALRELSEALKASDRAKNLISQILTFSRKATAEFTPVDLYLAIRDSLKMLRSVIPADIEIRENLKENIMVMSDPTQIHQIIMNLSINAAQAMEREGGVLTVTLGSEYIAADDRRLEPGLSPAWYAVISVEDTGHGISPDIKDKIFMPYYTTRDVGRGTGLGLAVIQGIIKNHKGVITCSSIQGEGTSFHIYIPELKTIYETAEAVEENEIKTGSGNILFVDDEPALTSIASEMLNAIGYNVVTEVSSVRAFDTFAENPDYFDLVITDMTMPSMSGDRLAEKIRSVRRDIPVIICTGYSDRISEERIKELGIARLCMKPLELREIAKIIHGILGGKR